MASTGQPAVRNQTGTVTGGAGAGFGSFGNFNPQWGSNPFNFTKTDMDSQRQNATAGQLGSFVATANNPNVSTAPSPNVATTPMSTNNMPRGVPQQLSSKGGTGLPSTMKFRSR